MSQKDTKMNPTDAKGAPKVSPKSTKIPQKIATSKKVESRLPAAIVPPPGLGKIICMRKICKKFDARSMQVYFFAKYYLKRLISPTTSQNEHPEGAK